MTILDNLPNIIYSKNEIHQTIINNEILDTTLHVIMVISNPCQYTRRIVLAKEFIKRMEKFNNMELYIVEMLYKCNIENGYDYQITSSDNPKHLQLYTDIPLWHKENMINIGLRKLLPPSWKAFAWIDADIEFDNVHWVTDTLKILNGSKDIVQLFSVVSDQLKDKTTQRFFYSFGHQYEHERQYVKYSLDYFHPGFAYAMTRKAYEQIGSLYELSILGSGDHNMSLSIISNSQKSVNEDVTDNYKKSVYEFEQKSKNLRFGYVPGLIKHYYHGSKANRKYKERWGFLVEHRYDPNIHVTIDKDGILIPTDKMPRQLIDDIMNYFIDRKEDD